MTERDIKLLWGRSGNRCAICKTELSQDKKLSSDKYPLGEQAHIVGEKESAARGKSNLSDSERDGYSNRILLCPNHHTEIDKDEQHYSVERLHFVKQQHELWVQERLSENTNDENQADDLIYAALIDAAVKYCDFQNWNSWISNAGDPYQTWHKDTVNGIYKFGDCVFRANWPGTDPELENALKTLSLALTKAMQTFMMHAEYGRQESSSYSGIAFYKLIWHEDQSVYHRLLKEYKIWVFEFSFWLWIATKAANWVCEIVRKNINPMFFAIEGRFISYGIGDDSIPEFSVAEKKILPKEIETLIENYRSVHPNMRFEQTF